MKTGKYRPADLSGDRGQPDHVIDGIGARIGVRLNAEARCQLPAVSGAAALGREIDRFPRITGPGRKRCTCLHSG